MLDSVRVRLTLWYSLVLAFVLVLLAVFTYFLYWRSISQRTDTGLSELADAFVTTFHAELKDETGPDAVKNAAHVAMLEHRFRDTVIAVLGPANNIVESSLELPRVSSSSREPITADLFSSKDFQSLVRETSSDPSGFRMCRAVGLAFALLRYRCAPPARTSHSWCCSRFTRSRR